MSIEIAKSRDKKSQSEFKASGERSAYKKATKFVPPTHPAYVVTSNFTSPHINTLQ